MTKWPVTFHIKFISNFAFQDLWDNVKHPNIQIIGLPGEEEKNKDHEKILEEIIVENVPDYCTQQGSHSNMKEVFIYNRLH